MYWKICFKVLISLDYYSIFSALLEAQSIGEARDTRIKIRGLGIQPGRVVYIVMCFRHHNSVFLSSRIYYES